nr:MAG: Protein of unknown function (DUF5131) [Bacteriophage sp.]
MNKFSGKAIYCSTGKAGEYATYACNFFVGCSNGCEYCYLKKGIGAKVLGIDHPELKKCFKDVDHAKEVFKKELQQNLEDLQKNGLFFSFTTDPMLPETIELTKEAIAICVQNNVNVTILTKRTDFFNSIFGNVTYGPICNATFDNIRFVAYKESISFGFTLTGSDDLEPGAASNMERIQMMKDLHDLGFKTWASIEPVIDIPQSLAMMNLTNGICDLYKVGLLSGKHYPKQDLECFVEMITQMFPKGRFCFKDTLLKKAGINREDLPDNCVASNYNIFKNQ